MSTVPKAVRASYGVLPRGWRLERLKFFATVRNSNVDKIVADNEPAVRLCNYTDVYNHDRITPDMKFMEGTASDAETDRFQLKAGQVLLTKDSESWLDIGISALVTEDMPGVVCGYHLAVVDSGEDLDGRYFAWLCRADPLNDQFKLGANGVTRFGLGQYPLKNAFIAVPPLATQRRIARFLDAKTARIDALIAKKRALLERLAEKRQALITQAVTKGLDPGVPMKDSGIDWLGQIPAHWHAYPLKRTLESADYGISATLNAEGDTAVLRMANVRDGELELSDLKFLDELDDTLLLRDGDVVFNRTNSLDMIGKAAIYRGGFHGRLSFASYLVRFRFRAWYRAEFANYVMGTEGLMTYARTLAYRSIGQANLNPSRYATIGFPVPPPDEQDKIVRRLRDVCARINDVSNQLARSTDRLVEYRSALITAAVTGQFEIPADGQHDRADECLATLAAEVA